VVSYQSFGEFPRFYSHWHVDNQALAECVVRGAVSLEKISYDAAQDRVYWKAAPRSRFPPLIRWLRLIKRVYEVDPMVCPKCQGQLSVIAIIGDSDELEGIIQWEKRRLEKELESCNARSTPVGRSFLETSAVK